MPEVRDIYAGSRSVYQVIKSDDGVTVTIRETQNPERGIDLIKSVIPILIQVLKEMAGNR